MKKHIKKIKPNTELAGPGKGGDPKEPCGPVA